MFDATAKLRVAATLFALALVGTPAVAPAAEPFTLDAVRAEVRQDYRHVAHLPADALAKALADARDVLLFDVREREEYAVSRIHGAVRVDPGIWTHSFLKRHGAAVRGKTVVFYCSVGVRSSKLAERVRTRLRAAGATAVYNLDGGIFGWHNEARPLTGDGGATPYVHPFDRHWGRLVERRELARTAPVP